MFYVQMIYIYIPQYIQGGSERRVSHSSLYLLTLANSVSLCRFYRQFVHLVAKLEMWVAVVDPVMSLSYSLAGLPSQGQIDCLQTVSVLWLTQRTRYDTSRCDAILPDLGLPCYTISYNQCNPMTQRKGESLLTLNLTHDKVKLGNILILLRLFQFGQLALRGN